MLGIKISKRHFFKAISWRLLGGLDTIILVYFFSGNFDLGLKISSIEIISKILLYYIHERIWLKTKVRESKRRHLYKTFTWRIIGTLDTMLLSTIISGNIVIGLKVSGVEIISKMILYYVHERLWYKSNIGISRI